MWKLLLPLTSSSSATIWNTSLTILVKTLCLGSPFDRYLLPQLHHPLVGSSLPTQGLHPDRRRWYLLASKLNSIMKEVLTEFWGDAVEIDDDAALTWMRQSHYYMGLYSYTYSAGLVISTAGYLHLKNSENGAKDWLTSSNQVVARPHLSQP